MPYHIDEENVTLEDLMRRLTESYLVPSRQVLQEGIKDKFTRLAANHITTVAQLRKALKTPKAMETLAGATGIDAEYLNLLRREVESHFPKPFPIRDFDWLNKTQLDLLEQKGYKNTALCFEGMESPSQQEELVKALKLDANFAAELFALVGLTRIQWVNPTFARLLLEAGYSDARAIAAADPEVLCDAVDQENQKGQYFKGKIGLGDIKRLIKSASYIA